jgi:hypothetical protein
MMNQSPDQLFQILSSERFLNMQGLANEVPIFIQTYDVADEDRMAGIIKALGSRLRNSGIKVAEVNLFNLLLDELRDEGLLDDLIKEESTFERADLYDTLKNHSDPASRLVPRLVRQMEHEEVRLTLLSGVGHIFPFLRAHTLLDSIQPAMMEHPVVLFFPGEYTQTEGLGSQLRLFGSQPSKGYYRAFNLDHYRLPSA